MQLALQAYSERKVHMLSLNPGNSRLAHLTAATAENLQIKHDKQGNVTALAVFTTGHGVVMWYWCCQTHDTCAHDTCMCSSNFAICDMWCNLPMIDMQ